ncbi:serine hydrolase domain-containing protein [Lysobacter silvisoli]|uniref:Class A beta-lactamase-related serine hydrolase n=1 Tax=Lysobacter silvisoli TaxID=2293254 RepID=A0A371K3D2_9GAMM|nr:serine hydrolase domain-containing protein [Lysobacter silvisoli]RDZ28394.1 class A beta-lactamase-related serine hydrolase [Lysobacter silvisoli]
MSVRSLLSLGFALILLSGCAGHGVREPAPLRGQALDEEVQRLMQAARVPGLALAVIEDGRVVHLKAYGLRDVERQLPLTTDTVMYGASITKAEFAYAVMTLVEDGRLDLDRSIAEYLPKPLPEYTKYADLAGDERWRKLTARILLTHSPGFANFRFFPPQGGYDPNGKLKFHFDPGQRYAYSGGGINLLQFVIEAGLGVDVGELMQQRVFDRYGMRRTALVWREDFAADLAIGYDPDNKPLGHKQRGAVRAAGSMDTTIADQAAFLAALSRGEGLSAAGKAELLRPQVAIDSIQQFPTLSQEATADNRGIELSYALGWLTYREPQGLAWSKGGHDDGTNNLTLCVADGRRCLVILSNSSNGEGLFKYLADATLGPTCLPWFWGGYVPYDHPEWRQPEARRQPHPPCAPMSRP